MILDLYGMTNRKGFMRKSTLQMALEAGHSRFLVDGLSSGNIESIAQWVEGKLISENSDITQTSKNAFYEAEKSLIRKYITENKFDKIELLLNTIDNERFHDQTNCKKLKLNQSRVLADAIKMAERFLKEDSAMHQGLHKLLEDRQKELQGMKCTAEEQSFKEKISTAINEALEIVPVASSSKVSK